MPNGKKRPNFFFNGFLAWTLDNLLHIICFLNEKILNRMILKEYKSGCEKREILLKITNFISDFTDIQFRLTLTNVDHSAFRQELKFYWIFVFLLFAQSISDYWQKEI